MDNCNMPCYLARLTIDTLGEAMSKRLTDTTKWNKRWFRRLSPAAKILFLYFSDNCDNAGFCEIDEETISHFTGLDIETILGFLEDDNFLKDIEVSDDFKYIWITDFIEHQNNLPLSENSNYHKQIIRLLTKQVDRFPNANLLLPDNIKTVAVKRKPTKPKKDINIPFSDFWDLYDKKVGKKDKIQKKWTILSDKIRTSIMEYLPKYKKHTPDKQYRKNPETFLNNHSWEDELISSNPPAEKERVKKYKDFTDEL